MSTRNAGVAMSGAMLSPAELAVRRDEDLVAFIATVLGVAEHDATGPSPAAIGPRDAPRHAGQVVRRVLLRRNIVI